MSITRRLAGAVAFSLVLAAGAPAQNGPPAGALSEQDREFLTGAAEAGRAAIEASQEALRKSRDPALRAFAQRMLDEQARAAAGLRDLARAKGVPLPSEPSIAQQSKLELLRASDGHEFDRNFAENFAVDAHRKALEMFRNQGAQGRDAQVKAFAEGRADALQQQLRLALEVRARVEGSPADLKATGAGRGPVNGSARPP
jgi:putative membrane protein